MNTVPLFPLLVDAEVYTWWAKALAGTEEPSSSRPRADAWERSHGPQKGLPAGLEAGAQGNSLMLTVRVAKNTPISLAEVQTSKLMTSKAENVPPSHSSSLETPQAQDTVAPAKIPPMPPVQTEEETQTYPGEIAPGMKWHPSQLRGEAQVQTSTKPDFLGAERVPLFASQTDMQKHASTLQLAANEVLPSASQTEPRWISSEHAISEEKQFLPSLHAETQEELCSQAVLARRLSPRTCAEAKAQTSHMDIPLGNKWQVYCLCTKAQVQTSCLQLPVSNSKTSLLQDTDVA